MLLCVWMLVFAASHLFMTDYPAAASSSDREAITRVIMAYRPSAIYPYSETVAPFVRDEVAKANPPSVGVARRWLLDVSRLALWTWQTGGHELESATVFQPDVIARYLSDEGGDWKSQRLRTTAVNLARIGNAINMTTYEPADVSPAQSLSAPYTKNDFPWIFSWAATQRTIERNLLAHAVLGFCGGAGLRTSEILALTREDIVDEGDRLLVTVDTGTSRTLVVEPFWLNSARTALSLAPASGTLLYPGWGTSRRGMFSSTASRSGGRTPRAHRLRNTWLVNTMQSYPLPLTLHLAGLSSVAALKRLDSYIAVPSDTALRSYLGGKTL